MVASPTLPLLPLQLTIERAVIELLLSDALPEAEPPVPSILAGLELVPASDHTILVGSLHAFVYCVNTNPVLPAGPMYKPDIVLTLVTSIFDHVAGERELWLGKIEARLRHIGLVFAGDTNPPIAGSGSFVTDDGKMRVRGLVVKNLQDISSDTQTGDAFTMIGGIITD